VLGGIPRASVVVTTGLLDPEATERGIAEVTIANGFVLFVHDEDCSEVAEGAGTGVLCMHQRRNPGPTTFVEATNSIRTFYSDRSEILESIPLGSG
jgi:dihydropteroate synthase